MHHERMKLAIEIIRSVPDEKLNLQSWQRGLWPDGLIATRRVEVTCKTIACAAGWLTLDPRMQEMGLTVGEDAMPTFADETAFAALAQFFDISYDHAHALFNARSSLDCELAFRRTDKETWLYRVELFTSNLQRFESIYLR
jgi:hypothetical protein